ncbi:MAG: hypothetical protein HC875_11165 [Anaerolineales bacterium]|nr:hypothetical protein [Anaerolineales bacterium]
MSFRPQGGIPQTRVILITILAFFLCGGLAFAGGLGLGFGLSDALRPTPTLIPETTSELTPIAEYEPVERPASQEDLALEEDFSGQSWRCLPTATTARVTKTSSILLWSNRQTIVFGRWPARTLPMP